MADTSETSVVDAVLSAFDDHDAERAADEFAPEGTFHEVPYDEVFEGPAIRTYFAGELFVSFPDYGVEARELVTTEDWATICRWSFAATHEGTVGPYEPTGNSVSLPIASVVTRGDDGIDSWRNFYDADALEAQLR